jgi:uncharacterized membrane protein
MKENRVVDRDSGAPASGPPDLHKEPVGMVTAGVEAAGTDTRTPPEETPGRKQVRLHANLDDLIAGIPIIPEDIETFRRRRELNEVVHRLLTVGLAVSTVTMIAGLVVDLLSRGEISGAAPHFREAVRGALSLQGAGILGVGLLLLIATPIMRVLGSFVAFLHERDWRYAGVTLAVLVILFMSMTFGKG